MFCILFCCYLGIKTPNAWERHEEYDARMRSEYYDPIELFPKKIDQLFEALDQVRKSRVYNKNSIKSCHLFRFIRVNYLASLHQFLGVDDVQKPKYD